MNATLPWLRRSSEASACAIVNEWGWSVEIVGMTVMSGTAVVVTAASWILRIYIKDILLKQTGPPSEAGRNACSLPPIYPATFCAL